MTHQTTTATDPLATTPDPADAAPHPSPLRPRLRRLRLSELHPHPLHRPAVTKAKRLRFAAVLDAAGYLAPLLVCPRTGGGFTVIDGHHRLEHAGHRGWARVDCLVVELDTRRARRLRSVIDSFVPLADPAAEAALLRACVADDDPRSVSRHTGLDRAVLRRRMRTQAVPPRPRRPRLSRFSTGNPR